MKQKCLLFGASGFIGSHLYESLKKRNMDVILSDYQKSQWITNDSFFIKADITKKSDFDKFKIKNLDYVFVFSAISDISESNKNPDKTLNVNILGLLNILNFALRHKVKKVIFASTIYVNSENGGLYKISKIAGENLIEEFHRQHKLKYNIIRYGSVYGPRSGPNNGIYKILYNALKNKKLEYRGHKSASREYIHVIDAAESTCDFLDKKFDNQILTLTGNQNMYVNDLLLLIKDIFKIKNNPKFIKQNLEGHYIKTAYNFKNKIVKKYSPQLHIDLAEGLVQTANFIKDFNKLK